MSDIIGNDTLTFLNDVVDLDVLDKDLVAFQITGTWTATLTWTASIDGVNFFAVFPINSSAATTTANANLWFNAIGISRFRLTATAFTSGTVVVNWLTANETPFPSMPVTNAGTGLIAGTAATSLGKAEDAPHTSSDTGVFALGVRNDAQTAFTNTDLDYSPIAVTPQGQLLVQPAVNISTSNRPLQFRLAAAGTTNATSIKATGGMVYSIIVANTSAAIKYVKFYNKATAPTVGTDTPTLVIGVPTLTTYNIDFATFGLSFTAGIAMATTVVGTDADATAVTASDLMITVLYF